MNTLRYTQDFQLLTLLRIWAFTGVLRIKYIITKYYIKSVNCLQNRIFIYLNNNNNINNNSCNKPGVFGVLSCLTLSKYFLFC